MPKSDFLKKSNFFSSLSHLWDHNSAKTPPNSANWAFSLFICMFMMYPEKMATLGKCLMKLLKFNFFHMVCSRMHYDISFYTGTCMILVGPQLRNSFTQLIGTQMPYSLHTFLHIFSKKNRFRRPSSLLRADYTKSANELLLYTNVVHL